MKKILLTLTMVIALLVTGIAQANAESKVVLGTSMPYGSMFTFRPTQVNTSDSVYVDWGDGVRKAHFCNPNSWGDVTKVSGKLLGDTIIIYCNLARLNVEEDSVFSLSFEGQTSLTHLYASKNQLTNEGLDLSGLSSLKILSLSNNNMMYLNLKEFTNLETFTIDYNPEFNTAVFANPGETQSSLSSISMNDCDIVHFYPVKMPNLHYLNIRNGSLMDITLEDYYPALSGLSLAGNTHLGEVDVTGCTELYSLDVSNTAITDINLTNCPELNSIMAHHTGISKLNITNNKALATINIANTNVKKLNVTNHTGLKSINIDSTSISLLDLSNMRFVQYVNARATNIEFLDMHLGIGYNRLKRLDIRDCKGFSAQSLNFTFLAMPPHEGSSYSTNVFIDGTDYKTSNTDLLEYDSDNYYKPDVEGDGTASMDSITITVVPVEGGTIKLDMVGDETQKDPETWEYFALQPITDKAIPGRPICVTPSPLEGYVYKGVRVNGKFYEDTIFVVSVNATVEPIFTQPGDVPTIVLTVPSGAEQQYFLKADNAGTTITVDWGDGEDVEYTINSSSSTAVYNESGTLGTKVTIKGDVTGADFSSYVGGFGTDNKITAIDLSGTTILRELCTWMNELGTLDVSGQPELTVLDCSYSDLDSINISQNPKLVDLDVHGNYLTSLDLTKAPGLKRVIAHGNWLESIDVSTNPLIEELQVQNNDELEELDVTNLANLYKLAAQGCALTSIDLTKNTKLVDLNLSSNRLTKVDLSQNTLMTTLYITDNQLEELDLSNNTNLNMIQVTNNNWDACQLNDFYYLLPEYKEPEGGLQSGYDLPTRLWVINPGAETAEGIIAEGKGWVMNVSGDGTGCDMAYVTILPYENGTVTVTKPTDIEVESGDQVAKNTEITIEATPAEGYIVDYVKANGESVTGGKYTITRSTEIQVRFVKGSGVNELYNGGLSIVGGVNQITVTTEGNTHVAIFGTTGVQHYDGMINGTEAIALNPGVYVVRAGDKAQTVLVR